MHNYKIRILQDYWKDGVCGGLQNRKWKGRVAEKAVYRRTAREGICSCDSYLMVMALGTAAVWINIIWDQISGPVSYLLINLVWTSNLSLKDALLRCQTSLRHRPSWNDIHKTSFTHLPFDRKRGKCLNSSSKGHGVSRSKLKETIFFCRVLHPGWRTWSRGAWG